MISRHCPSALSGYCRCTKGHTALPLAAGALEYLRPVGLPSSSRMPLSISFRMSLSPAAVVPTQAEGGDHGSATWMLSPAGYSVVALPMLTPTSRNHSAFEERAAVFTLAGSSRT